MHKNSESDFGYADFISTPSLLIPLDDVTHFSLDFFQKLPTFDLLRFVVR